MRLGILVSDRVVDEPADSDESSASFSVPQEISEHAELKERGGLADTIADGLLDCERLLEVGAGGGVIAFLNIDQRQLMPDGGLASAMPDGVRDCERLLVLGAGAGLSPSSISIDAS